MNGPVRDRRLDERDELSERYAENDLIRWLQQAGDAIRPHLKTILIVVAAALALWAYFAWRNHQTRTQRTAAWNEYFAEDYETVISKYQSTDAALHARMRLAEAAIQEGKANLISKRSDAIRSFEKAEQHLDTIISDGGAPIDMRRTAMYLKALALESSGAPEKAKEQYNKLVTQFRDSPEARLAEQRVKELSKPSAIEFYRQLANYKPGDRPAPPPPMFDANDLLKGLEGSTNPNIPKPPPVGDSSKDAKASEKKPEAPPPPPPKKETAQPPGKDLPETKKTPEKKPESPKK
jgi:tetratricopeptide (TPR) repeat protein